MAHTDERTGGFFGVDGNGVPVGWHWNVIRRFTDDDSGASLGEARLPVPFTTEELAQHVSAALVAQAADIESDRVVRAAIAAERDQALADLRASQAETATVQEALHAAQARIAELEPAE